jgi:hypothetical protein
MSVPYCNRMTTSIESIQRNELLKMQPWRNLRRIQYMAGRKVLHRFSGGNIYSSGVYILDNYLVAKHLHTNMTGYVFWKNEINALKRVVGRPHFPQLVAADPERLIIYMTYCGPSLEGGGKIPRNWKAQVEEIRHTLEAKGLNPNDILPRNICVKQDTLHLIDFGLANVRHNELMNSIRKLRNICETRAGFQPRTNATKLRIPACGVGTPQ